MLQKWINLKKVKQNELLLAHIYIHIQTPKLCLEAVKQNGFTLQYVLYENFSTEIYEKICLQAIKQDKRALQHIMCEKLKKELEIK